MTAARLRGTDFPPFLRTDFTDDEAWEALLAEVDKGWVTPLADPSHRDLSVSELMALVPDGSAYRVLVVADRVTFSSDERTLLLIDVREEPGRTFRAVPDACESAVGLMTIGHRFFDDYLDLLPASGVYRLSERHHRAAAELRGHVQPHTDVVVPAPPAVEARAVQRPSAASALRCRNCCCSCCFRRRGCSRRWPGCASARS